MEQRVAKPHREVWLLTLRGQLCRLVNLGLLDAGGAGRRSAVILGLRALKIAMEFVDRRHGGWELQMAGAQGCTPQRAGHLRDFLAGDLLVEHRGILVDDLTAAAPAEVETVGDGALAVLIATDAAQGPLRGEIHQRGSSPESERIGERTATAKQRERQTCNGASGKRDGSMTRKDGLKSEKRHWRVHAFAFAAPVEVGGIDRSQTIAASRWRGHSTFAQQYCTFG